MSITRREFAALTGLALGGCGAMPRWLAQRCFEATWASLISNYCVPE